jgi:hypothetical protein
MAMVLCGSRQKHIYFQTSPFTTSSAIEAHRKAFEYFQGQPVSIIYDQDRVFIVEENMGDLLLTQDFKSFVSACGFKAIFCRKSDPESKGKIENVVKYVKNNFCKGRVYKSLDTLNQWAIDWLNRTANAKVHQGTQKVPQQEWLLEKEYLQPISHFYTPKIKELPRYKVRKDNTIHYKSNYYTLPMGSYKSSDCWVYLEEKDGKITLLDDHKSILTSHFVSIDKGATIRNTDHRRDKSQSMASLKNEVLLVLGNSEKAVLFLENLIKDKPRYARDNFNHLIKITSQYSNEMLDKTLQYCLESTIYNAYRFEEILIYHQKEHTKDENFKTVALDSNLKNSTAINDFIPKTSSIQNYSHLF